MAHQEKLRSEPADEIQRAIAPLIAAVESQDRSRVGTALREIIRNGPALFPVPWLELTADALDRGNFDSLSEPFRNAAFVGPAGHLLVIGPYIQRREGTEETVLSALLGKRIDLDPPPPGIAATVEALQRAPLLQAIQPIIPIECLASTGNLGGEHGEAFIVPDGWGWRDSAYGPAINNMDEQLRRFDVSGRRCIERIFDADTAALLLTPMDASKGGLQVRHRSYDIHECGHSAGLGMVRKVEQGLLSGYWYRCIEEYRADGIGFEVGAQLLDERAAGNDLASNLCIRFGMDAHRSSVDSDGDVACVLLLIDRLFAQGGLQIKGGRLALRDVSYRGLVQTFESWRYEAVELTRRELQLERPTGLLRLYGTIPVHASSTAILEGLVREPCRKFFTSLR